VIRAAVVVIRGRDKNCRRYPKNVRRQWIVELEVPWPLSPSNEDYGAAGTPGAFASNVTGMRGAQCSAVSRQFIP